MVVLLIACFFSALQVIFGLKKTRNVKCLTDYFWKKCSDEKTYPALLGPVRVLICGPQKHVWVAGFMPASALIMV